jgi:uncharacterized protein
MSKNETTNEVKNESKFKKFLKRKNIEISVQRYLIDALGLMAQGLFASLLIGTIMKTIGIKLHIPFLNELLRQLLL